VDVNFDEELLLHMMSERCRTKEVHIDVDEKSETSLSSATASAK